ncbi:polynucleotide 5'-hydroxyl-kinase NOL9-like isoform X2 [Canna indica]|uniref:Polynucleotide 5'-hydroxyl-kinase NOL9-like isoform X2 n=1 Tax=Canna indica TaxID=4628 RepID=A0AAQ3PZM5_9LILI|nr:polynucleotide 5'-hydroxyl-kinase NOL9-like isoform X2 [Canna indica]
MAENSGRRFLDEGWPVPDCWKETADCIAYGSSSPPAISLVCGPGNSGKSTFSRILLNTLLQSYKRVAYLDTDVGQPEFSTPGCLSLHVIDEQTPDLTILCIKRPERCFFFGDVTAQRDPKSYLNYIFSLFDHFVVNHYKSTVLVKSQYSMLPLVINTSGWVKGVGYDMLVEMLRYMSPTHVVHIRVSAERKNLPSGFFWVEGNEKTSVNLMEIPALHGSSTRQAQIKKEAHIIRDVRLLAYFRQCLPKELLISSYKELEHFFACTPPYEIPLSRIKLKHIHCQVSSSEVNDSLKTTIVGLAISSDFPSSSAHCIPWCVGLGIIRGVDTRKDRLYLVTPVPSCKLEKVDILFQGCLETPACFCQ